jgi:hypothetical protein
MYKIGDFYDQTFEGLSDQERKERLEAIADNLENRAYTKPLNDIELAARKDQLANVSIELNDIAIEKKAAIDHYKEMEKVPLETKKDLLQAIKFKSVQISGTLYGIANHVEGMMYFFDQAGTCVDARPLLQAEKQLRIKAV